MTELGAMDVSLRLAVWTVVLLAPVALGLGWWLARTPWRGRAGVEVLVALPLALPPTVLGFYLLLLQCPTGVAGRAWQAVSGAPLAFSFAGIVIASLIANLPLALAPVRAAMAGVPRELTEAARTLGDSRLSAARRVLLPLTAHGLVAGLGLAFARAMGEFGVVLMVGGNIPGRTRTLAIAVYDQVLALDYGAAHRSAALLIGLSLLTLALVNRRRGGMALA